MRIKAIRRYLEGEKPVDIYRDLGVSKVWFFKWLKRYKEGNPEWYKDISRAPKSPHYAVDKETERIIVNIRKELENTKYAQIGANAINRKLMKLNISSIPVWIINRILKRNGLIKHQSKKYKSKGKYYKYFKANTPNEIHQTDIIGPRYIDKSRFYSLNTMDIFTHKIKIKSILNRNSINVAQGLIDVWKVIGIPKYSQFDNQQVFWGCDRNYRQFGRIIWLCLYVGIEPVFIDFRAPWMNAEIEHFNRIWNKEFFYAQHFDSFENLIREEVIFENFHNEEYVYSVLKGQSPNTFISNFGYKPNLLDSGFTIDEVKRKKEGKIHVVRFIRSDMTINIFGEKFILPPECQYEYVKGTIDLEREILQIYLFNELVEEFKYVIPK